MEYKSNENLNKLEETIGYSFKGIEFLSIALTHSSYANSQDSKLIHNERLEFLGDSILSMIISLHLYRKMHNVPEGQLTRTRANIVCENSLFIAAKSIDLGSYIYMSKGEENTGGRKRPSILADTFEAIIAAVYLDGGFDKAEKLVLTLMKDIIESSIDNKIFNDYKSFFQEYAQKYDLGPIEYTLLSEKGPDHSKVFYMALVLNKNLVGKGKGNSKKDAQQAAAKNAMKVMGLINE